jgi:hypothetical protein
LSLTAHPNRRGGAAVDLLVETSKTIPTEVAETPFDRRASREAFISTIHSNSRFPLLRENEK